MVPGKVCSWFMRVIGSSRSRATNMVREEEIKPAMAFLSGRSSQLAKWSVIEIWTETDSC